MGEVKCTVKEHIKFQRAMANTMAKVSQLRALLFISLSLLFLFAGVPPCLGQQATNTTDADAGTVANETETIPCPPEGFDSMQEGFNLSAWVEHPWFIQEQMPVSYQPLSDFYCTRARYKQVSDDEVEVYNSANQGSVDGTSTGADSFGPLKAVIPNTDDPSKLKVGPPFLPTDLYGDYWVMFAGPTPDNYEYGIVSGGAPTNVGEDGGCVAGSTSEMNQAGLWLFTKEPTPDQSVVDMLLNKTSELGFDLSVLSPVEHEGCTYPAT